MFLAWRFAVLRKLVSAPIGVLVSAAVAGAFACGQGHGLSSLSPGSGEAGTNGGEAGAMPPGDDASAPVPFETDSPLTYVA